jgi:hypothetical protein
MNIEEIKAREQAATPGPWEASRDRTIGNEKINICHCSKDVDTTFIAHASTDIPELIAEVERLQYTILGIMHSVDKWFDIVPSEDEVNRATDAREIALKEIERLTSENSALQNANDKLVKQSKRIISCNLDYSAENATLKKALELESNELNKWLTTGGSEYSDEEIKKSFIHQAQQLTHETHGEAEK